MIYIKSRCGYYIKKIVEILIIFIILSHKSVESLLCIIIS